MYECQRCLRKRSLVNMVMISCALPKGRENYQLCVDCYNDSKLKVDPKKNSFAIQKKLKKKAMKDK